MKNLVNNAFVHVVIVGLFSLLTQYLTSNAYDSLTVGVVVHAAYEWILAYTKVGSTS